MEVVGDMEAAEEEVEEGDVIIVVRKGILRGIVRIINRNDIPHKKGEEEEIIGEKLLIFAAKLFQFFGLGLIFWVIFFFFFWFKLIGFPSFGLLFCIFGLHVVQYEMEKHNIYF